MSENFIMDMLILNQGNYQRFGDQQYYDGFEFWMNKLKDFKGFDSIEEACDYFIAQGEMQNEEISYFPRNNEELQAAVLY